MVTNSNHLKQGSWWDLTSEIKVGAKSKLFVIVDNFYCRSASSQFTVLSQPCVLHSVPGASASSDMERCQRLPILCRKKPKRTVKLSFDKLPWLFNRLVFLCSCFWSSLWSHFFTFLELCYPFHSFFAQCVFVFVTKEAVWVSKREKERGGVAWEQCEFSREWVTEKRVREMLSVCQRKQFSWLGCQWSSETMRLPSEKTLSHSFPLIHGLTLPDSMYYLIERWGFFPVTVYLTKPSVLTQICC